MRTGLTKKQKTTVIYSDEHSRITEAVELADALGYDIVWQQR